MMRQGLVPVLLDMDYQSPVAKVEGVVRLDRRHPWLWDGERVGDAATLCALIENAEAFVGIDSGPAHVAAATTTPSIVIWRGTCPWSCFDPSPNVRHWVPYELKREVPTYFHDHYDVRWYTEGEDLQEDLEEFIAGAKRDLLP
jgi:hypothetical protein